MYPRTIPGRILTLFICLVGLAAVSLMTVSLQNTLTMTNAEQKVDFSIKIRL